MFLLCSNCCRIVLPMETAKGRGARSNATGRYEPEQHLSFDDGWTTDDAETRPSPTAA